MTPAKSINPEIVRAEWRSGWSVLLGAFLAMGSSWNIAGIALSVFLVPMQVSMGWSRTALSIAPMVGLVSALMLPITGVLLDRFGARRVALCGTGGMTASLGAFAVMPNNFGVFLGLVVLLAAAGATVNSFVLARGLASWFEHRLGTAIGLLFVGVSLGLALILPFLSAVIVEHGWRAGFAAFAGIGLCVSFPSLVFLFREPAGFATNSSLPMSRPDPYAVLFRQPAFRRLGIAVFLAAIPIGGGINHLVPLLAGQGLSVIAVGSLGSIFAIAIGVGGFANGALYDRLRPTTVVAVTLALSAVGTAMLWGTVASSSFMWLAAAVFLAGLATGAEGDYITFFSNRLFGLMNFARVVSSMALIISLGMALGGLAFARTFDSVQSYGPALLVGVVLYVLAAGLFLSLRMPSGRS